MAKYIFALLLMLQAIPAKADFWGGDLIYLSQILQKSILQLEQLKNITNAGKEAADILREANRGVNQALYLQQTINRTLKAGTFSDIKNMKEMLHTVKTLYGRIPKTSQSKLHKKTDLTVAESFSSTGGGSTDVDSDFDLDCLFGGGYAFPIGRETRLLVGLYYYTSRQTEDFRVRATNLNVGFLF